MLVRRETDYAMRCVFELARNERMSVREIGRIRRISTVFLGKIVQKLARAGIVVTRRGAGGGVSLAKAPTEVTLLEVMEAIEGPVRFGACTGGRPLRSHLETCPVHPYLCEAQSAVRSILDVSLADAVGRLHDGSRHAAGEPNAANTDERAASPAVGESA